MNQVLKYNTEYIDTRGYRLNGKEFAVDDKKTLFFHTVNDAEGF